MKKKEPVFVSQKEIDVFLLKSKENFQSSILLQEKGWFNAALSRLYYSLFLLIKYKLKGYDPGPGGDSHKKTFEKLCDEYYFDFSQKLTNFKKMRVSADYQSILIAESDFKNWHSNYLEIQKDLETIA